MAYRTGDNNTSSYLITRDDFHLDTLDYDFTYLVAYKAAKTTGSNHCMLLSTNGWNVTPGINMIHYMGTKGVSFSAGTEENISSAQLGVSQNDMNSPFILAGGNMDGGFIRNHFSVVKTEANGYGVVEKSFKGQGKNRGSTSSYDSHKLWIGSRAGSVSTRSMQGEIYYVACLNRVLSPEELDGLGRKELFLYDDLRDILLELWDFQTPNETQALHGLISGTVLDAVGADYEFNENNPFPVSKHTPSFIQGQVGTSIYNPPPWLSTLDVIEREGVIVDSLGESLASSAASALAAGISLQEISSTGNSQANAELSTTTSSLGYSAGASVCLGKLSSSLELAGHAPSSSPKTLGSLSAVSQLAAEATSTAYTNILMSAWHSALGESFGYSYVASYFGGGGIALATLGGCHSVSAVSGELSAGASFLGGAYGQSFCLWLADFRGGSSSAESEMTGRARGVSFVNGMVVPIQTLSALGNSHGSSSVSGLFYSGATTNLVAGTGIMIAKQNVYLEVGI